MSLISNLSSLQSSLGSLTSGASNIALATPVDNEQQPSGASQSGLLLDFLTVATQSGLRQYGQDIAEEGLVAARLGDGTDYVVDQARSPDGEVVVVKHVKATIELDSVEDTLASQDHSRIRKVLHEIRFATHPSLKDSANILQMKGFGWELSETSLTTPFLVVEYAEYGTLRDYLQYSMEVKLPSKVELCVDMAKGLLALHSHCIAHGDLKLENVLVCRQPRDPIAKLTDFGLSVLLNDEQRTFEYWGTEQYRPPEVWEQTGASPTAGLISGVRYRACDIYVYGLACWETLIDGNKYFRGLSTESIQGQHEVRKDALQCLESIEGDYQNLKAKFQKVMEASLDPSPDNRPQIETIISLFRSQPNVEGLKRSNVPIIDSAQLSAPLIDAGFTSFNQLFATLAGHELEDRSVHMAPWIVQETVAEGLLHKKRHNNLKISARACFEFAICHYLGFGVDRDSRKVLEYMDEAAAKGSFEARRIRRRLYQALSEPFGSLAVEVRLEEQEEQQLQRIDEAEAQYEIVNPFEVFEAVNQTFTWGLIDDPYLDLHKAAYLGDTMQLRALLSSTKDYRDDEGRTALFLACQGGQLDTMKVLLEHDSSPAVADDDGHTPLHMLIVFGSAEVEAALSLLLQFSPDLDLNTFSPSILDASEHWCELWGAPLHWAVLAGNEAMVLALVKRGARVHDWPQDSCPIRIATSLHLSNILEMLINAMPQEASLIGENPFYSLNASNPFRRLLIHGKNYQTAIKKTVSILCKKWPVTDSEENSWHGNPLRKILVLNMSDADRFVAKALIDAGAHRDTYEGLTLLQSSILGCRGSHLPSICRMALDMIDIPQDYFRASTEYRQGWTALHWAAASGIIPVAERLLKVAPALVNKRTGDDEGRTALHLAAESGRGVGMASLLLSNGADPQLTTHNLRLTPLGSFLSNQRSELNKDILSVLLTGSKPGGYLVFSSDNWNVLHYAVGRAATLDAESLPGHLLLRTLATFPDIKSLINSTTAEGWSPLHIACYFVDYTSIKILVEEYGADVQASIPKGARSFDIVLERARRFPKGLRGADSLPRWTKSAYRSALFLLERLEAFEGPFHLTKLHIAAYIGFFDEVVRLAGRDLNALVETNSEQETPREMLQNTLPVGIREEWALKFCEIAEQVLEFLNNMELELEEQNLFAEHRSPCEKA